jgi:hypothetical protein
VRPDSLPPPETDHDVPIDRAGWETLAKLALYRRCDLIISPETYTDLRRDIDTSTPSLLWEPNFARFTGARIITEVGHDGVTLRPWGNGHGGGS